MSLHRRNSESPGGTPGNAALRVNTSRLPMTIAAKGSDSSLTSDSHVDRGAGRLYRLEGLGEIGDQVFGVLDAD